MPTEIILPKVDMDMATGKISRWYVKNGAAVKKGDVLFEIETDKAAMEIEAPASGIVRDIIGQQEIDTPVGQAVAWDSTRKARFRRTNPNILPQPEMAGACGSLSLILLSPAMRSKTRSMFQRAQE